MMPPSWMILSSIHVLDPTLDPLYLSIIGATGSTAGRYILTYIGHISRRFISEDRRTNLENIRKYIENRKYAYIIVSFIFALTPLPSNMLFIAIGIMKSKTIGLFFGFWLGRFISYFILIYYSHRVFKPFIEIFSSQLVGILVLDLFGLFSIVLFALIDWQKLIIERKFHFIKPKLK